MTNKAESKTETSIRNRKLIYLAVAIMIALILTVYFHSISSNRQGEPRAAIIDQLGSSKLTEPVRYQNQTFIETAKELLFKRFSFVDYYSDNATVAQYKHLASAGYKLIVWRAHSALDLDSKYVAIATAEMFDSRSYGEYLDKDQLTKCIMTTDNSSYFGITPEFVEQIMDGRFQDTVIVFMSCNGLNQQYLKTAEAFEKKGVKVFISWDQWVNVFDNDDATSLLLQYLINKNDNVSSAVDRIPPYTSEGMLPTRLDYYPHNPEAADYRVPDYREHSSASDVAPLTMPVSRKIKEPHCCPDLSDRPCRAC